jgi:hypothetical protein
MKINIFLIFLQTKKKNIFKEKIKKKLSTNYKLKKKKIFFSSQFLTS